jgi:hypothetical protein
MSTRDYRRFMNFLAAHDCGVGFREFRGPVASSESLPGNVPPLRSRWRPSTRCNPYLTASIRRRNLGRILWVPERPDGGH